MTQPDPIAPETLLAEADFIRSVVRDLLQDPDSVEEVVQSTWVQAWRRLPSAVSNRKGWLARIARSRAKDLLRADRARSRYETNAEPAQPIPDPGEILQREAERRNVVTAVLSLPKLYREPILLRYYQDLPSATIRQRLEISASTLRSRLHRGRELLRQHLDDQHGGDRQPWVMALLPFAYPDQTAIASCSAAASATIAPRTGKLLLRAGAMSTTMKTLSATLLTLLLMTLGYAVWQDIRPKVAEPSPGNLAKASEPKRTHGPSSGSTTADRVARNNLPAAATTMSLLVTDDTRPMPGVGVRIDILPGAVTGRTRASLPPTGRKIRSTSRVSDADGRITLAWTPVDELCTVLVTPEHRDRFLGERQIELGPGESPPGTLRVSLIPMQYVVRGTVRGPDGQPIHSATVHYYDYRICRTNKNGSYTLRMPAGLPISVWARGYALATKVLPRTDGNSGDLQTRVDFDLQHGKVLAGTVVDEWQQPIANAAVTWSRAWLPTTTDKNGRFLIDSIDPKVTDLRVYARHKNFVSGGVPVQHNDQGLIDVRLQLERGATVRGRVFAAEGPPVAGARIFTSTNALANGCPDAITDASGRFTVSPLRGGRGQRVIARKRGHGLTIGTVDLPTTGVTPEMILRLGEELVLRGRVIDRHGRPIRGAQLSVGVGDAHLDNRIGDIDLLSDQDGRFAIHSMPHGKLYLWVSARGYSVRHLHGLHAGQAPVQVTLVRRAGVGVRVVDATTGKPIRRFRVWFRATMASDDPGPGGGPQVSPTGWQDGHWLETKNGEWTMREAFLAGGRIDLRIAAEGYRRQTLAHRTARPDPKPEHNIVRLERE